MSPRPRRVRGHRRSSTSSTTCRPTRSSRRRWPAPTPSLPVLSIAAPFNRAAAIPQGDVTIRDVAGPLHLRQHAARRDADRCPGQGLPGVLGEVLQAGHRHRPGARRQRHQRRRRRRRRTAPRTTTTTSGRARRAADLRHRPRASRSARGSSASRTPARRSTRRPAVRDRGQQLPAVRRRQLPARQHGARSSTTRRSRSGSCSSTGSSPTRRSTRPSSRPSTGGSSRAVRRSPSPDGCGVGASR